MSAKPLWLGASIRRAALLFAVHCVVGIIFVRLWEAPTVYAVGLVAYPPSTAFLFLLASEAALRLFSAWQEPVPWVLLALLFTAVAHATVRVSPAAGVPVLGYEGAARLDLAWLSPWVCLTSWVASSAAGLVVRLRPL
ncbi:MAG: hypothetical protein AB7F50_11130 [Fimbriimonadaceae bacterium]